MKPCILKLICITAIVLSACPGIYAQVVNLHFPVRFTVDGGDPLPINTIQVAASYGARTRATGTFYSLVHPDGKSNLVLPPGEYTIALQGLPSNWSIQSITYGAADLLKTPLLANSIPTSEILVKIGLFPPKNGTAAKVQGSVTNVPPAPYLFNPQIHLTRIPAEGGGVLNTPMNDDGTFMFPRVPAGKYILSTTGMESSVQFAVTVAGADIPNVTVALTGIANPFRDYPGSTWPMNFATGQIALQGVITQVITSVGRNTPLTYFRMEVTDSKTGKLVNWAVLVSTAGSRPADIPDNAKLKVGTHITIQANPARDGTHNALLVRAPDANTTVGIRVD